MAFYILADYLAQQGLTLEQVLARHRAGEITLYGWRCVWGLWGNPQTKERPESIRYIPVPESFCLHWEQEPRSDNSVLLWGDAPFEAPPDYSDPGVYEELLLGGLGPLRPPQYRRGWVVLGAEVGASGSAEKAPPEPLPTPRIGRPSKAKEIKAAFLKLETENAIDFGKPMARAYPLIRKKITGNEEVSEGLNPVDHQPAVQCP